MPSSFLFYLLQYVFFEREIKKRGVCGSADGKELEKYIESFFSVLTKCVFILTPYNINAISALTVMNNIRKDLVMIAAHYGIKTLQIRAQN